MLVYPIFSSPPAHAGLLTGLSIHNPLAHTGVYSLVYPFTSPPVSIHWVYPFTNHLPTHLFTGLSLHQLTCPHVYSLVYPLPANSPHRSITCLKTSFSITLLLIFMAQKPFQGSPIFLMLRVSMAGNPFQGSLTLPWLLGRSRFHGQVTHSKGHSLCPGYWAGHVSMAGNPFQGSLTLPWLLGRSCVKESCLPHSG